MLGFLLDINPKENQMKKFLLSFALMALIFSADAQLVPLQIYNGMPFPITLNSVAVRDLSTCGPGATVSVGVTIAPNTIYTVNPLQPGNASVDWAGAKVSDLSAASYLRTIHPYFQGCWLPSVNGGPDPMNGYWYPINSTPYQVLKIYPF